MALSLPRASSKTFVSVVVSSTYEHLHFTLKEMDRLNGLSILLNEVFSSFRKKSKTQTPFIVSCCRTVAHPESLVHRQRNCFSAENFGQSSLYLPKYRQHRHHPHLSLQGIRRSPG